MSVLSANSKVVLIKANQEPYALTPAPVKLKKLKEFAATHYGKEAEDIEITYYTFKAMRQKRIENDMEYRLCLSEFSGWAQLTVLFLDEQRQKELDRLAEEKRIEDEKLREEERVREAERLKVQAVESEKQRIIEEKALKSEITAAQTELEIKKNELASVDSNGVDDKLIFGDGSDSEGDEANISDDKSVKSYVTASNIAVLHTETEEQFAEDDLIEYLSIFNGVEVPFEFLEDYRQSTGLFGTLRLREQCHKLKNDLYRPVIPDVNIDFSGSIMNWIESVLETVFKFHRNDPFSYQKSKRMEATVKAYLFHPKVSWSRNTASVSRICVKYGEYVMFLQGNTDKALDNFNKALTIAEDCNDESLMAKCYNALGRAYLQSAEVKKAEEVFMKCLDLREKLYGLRHAKTANALFYLGNSAFAAGNHERAINLHKDAITMMKELHGSDHIKISLFLNTVSKDFIARCDYSQAHKIQNNALMILEQHYGELHPEVISIYGGLSRIAYAQQDFTLALQYLTKSKRLIKNLYEDPSHHDLGSCYCSIAELELELGNYKVGSKCLSKAKSIAVANYGPIHENVIKCDNLLKKYKVQPKKSSKCCEIF